VCQCVDLERFGDSSNSENFWIACSVLATMAHRFRAKLKGSTKGGGVVMGVKQSCDKHQLSVAAIQRGDHRAAARVSEAMCRGCWCLRLVAGGKLPSRA